MLPLRDETIHEGPNTTTDLVALAKKINDQVEKYLHEQRGAGKKVREQISVIERHLCVEILERRPLDVILTPLVKFQMASDGWASGADFNRHALLEKQPEAIARLHDEVSVIGAGLTGRNLDQAGMQQFVVDHYDPVRMRWFSNYEKAWSSASIALRLPDRPSPQPRWAHDFISMIPNAENVIPGVPVYFFGGVRGDARGDVHSRPAAPGARGLDPRDALHLVRGDHGGRDECAVSLCVRSRLLHLPRGGGGVGDLGHLQAPRQGPDAAEGAGHGNSRMYCVIGSGPAAISAAMALVKRGLPVTILDGGKTLEPERQSVLDRLGAQRPEEWSAGDLDHLRGEDQSSRHGSIHSKRTYGSEYPYDDVGEPLVAEPERTPFHYSMARGGLSNVWGASILPSHQRDMDAWPITADDLAEHYRAVLEFTPSSGVRDELEELLPTYVAVERPLKQSRQIGDLLADLRKRQAGAAKGGDSLRQVARDGQGGGVRLLRPLPVRLSLFANLFLGADFESAPGRTADRLPSGPRRRAAGIDRERRRRACEGPGRERSQARGEKGVRGGRGDPQRMARLELARVVR